MAVGDLLWKPTESARAGSNLGRYVAWLREQGIGDFAANPWKARQFALAKSGELRFRDTLRVDGRAKGKIVSDNTLIVGETMAFRLTAFDINSGAVKWSWPGDGPSYGSPVIATIGHRQYR